VSMPNHTTSAGSIVPKA